MSFQSISASAKFGIIADEKIMFLNERCMIFMTPPIQDSREMMRYKILQAYKESYKKDRQMMARRRQVIEERKVEMESNAQLRVSAFGLAYLLLLSFFFWSMYFQDFHACEIIFFYLLFLEKLINKEREEQEMADEQRRKQIEAEMTRLSKEAEERERQRRIDEHKDIQKRSFTTASNHYF